MHPRTSLFEPAHSVIERESLEYPIHHLVLNGTTADLDKAKKSLGTDEFIKKINSTIELINCKNDQYVSFTPLNLALNYKDANKAIWLIQNGADINIQDSRSYYPIHLAVEENLITATEELIKFHANVNALTNFNLSPLFFANSCEMIKLLIKYQANPNARDNEDRTPLIMYCHVGAHQLVKEILEVGNIDIDHTDKNGYRAIHHAITSLNFGRQDKDIFNPDECVATLIAYKANIDIPDKDPRELAQIYRKDTIYKILTNAQNKTSSSTKTQTTSKNPEPKSTITSPHSTKKSCCQIS